MTDRRPPQGLARVATIECRIAPYDWAFAKDEAARIDAHWRKRVAASPGLFDGLVLLSDRLEIADGVLRGTCFETRYRNFLSWRDFGFPDGEVTNCFAMPALQAVDGAFLLGEMSAGTANAGKLYFPAGTPEPADADAEGRVDFDANILRELEEETGLAPHEVTLDSGWTLVVDGPLVACMKIVRSALPVEALQARLARFNEGQSHPELTRLVPVRGGDDFDVAHMPGFMLLYLRQALGLA